MLAALNHEGLLSPFQGSIENTTDLQQEQPHDLPQKIPDQERMCEVVENVHTAQNDETSRSHEKALRAPDEGQMFENGNVLDMEVNHECYIAYNPKYDNDDNADINDQGLLTALKEEGSESFQELPR